MTSSENSSKKKNPRNSSQLSPALQVLQGLFHNVQSPLSEQFTRWKLWRYWNDVVGSQIAQMSVPVEFRRGRLVIWAKNSAHLQDLHFVAETIRKKVNTFLGGAKVHSIRFTLDESRVPPTELMPENLDL